MGSFAAQLGLRASQSRLASTPCYAAYYLFFHFIFAYAISGTRIHKFVLGLDHNVSPREDIAKYGEAAVKSGKITERQLKRLKRNDAAHNNSVENYPLLVAALLSAQYAGLQGHTINRAALVYTGARIVYVIAYIVTERHKWTLIRSNAWWVGNISCLYLLWKAGKSLNN